MNFPRKCLVDTNVPVTANLSHDPSEVPDDLLDCVQACVNAIDHVINKGEFVIDAKDEIYSEYLNNLSLSGRKGIGNIFMKWVHDNRWTLPESDRVQITRCGESYKEFPVHEKLDGFDNSDRKFVAAANAHPARPPILQATDSKWWGWKEPLNEVGIYVCFLCQNYVEAKYAEKMQP